MSVGKEFFGSHKLTLFLQNGRKWGKTEFAIYLLWRHALLNPKSACYYVTPEMAHGRKLVWTDPRLANFGSSDYIAGINSNEMIIRFKNGSFIQVIGSENYAAANGLRPAFMVYDEFCEFHPRFHETMQPNRIVYKCPLVIIGTPPLQDSRNREQYVGYAEECRNRQDAIWVRRTSYDNPHIQAADLDSEKAKLFARGEEYLWYSQYEAQITAGGKHVVFPMLSRAKHVRPHVEIVEEIRRDLHKLEFHVIADPGTTTVMALLFCAINPYSKRLYLLDCIYETDSKKTSVQSVMPKTMSIVKELTPKLSLEDDWSKVYDEAAAWFASEVASQYGLSFMPTLKAHNKKDFGISLIKDILVHGVVSISDRCEKLTWEMENYIADDQGKLPKTNDHLIDCFRYWLAAIGYSMVEVMEAVRSLGPRHLGDEMPRRNRRELDADDDWTSWAD